MEPFGVSRVTESFTSASDSKDDELASLAAGSKWHGSTFYAQYSTAARSELSLSVDEAEPEAVRSSESQLLLVILHRACAISFPF